MCPTTTRSVASSGALVEVEVDVHVVGDRRRAKVIVVGEVDRFTVPDLVAALDIAPRAGRGASRAAGLGVEVDLSRTTFMDVSGLRALLDLHLRLGRRPEAVVLVDPHPSLRWILDLPGIDLVFAIRFTRERAPAPVRSIDLSQSAGASARTAPGTSPDGSLADDRGR